MDEIKNVFINAAVGGFLCGLFAFLTGRFSNTPSYIKIFAFVYAAPCLYFYLLYMLSRQGKNQMVQFTRHALFGTLVSAVIIFVTVLFQEKSATALIVGNLIALLFVLFIYFVFKMYNLF